MNPKIIEISYSIELSETQSKIIKDKSAADFITYMENQTRAKKIDWIFGMVIATMFVTLDYSDSIEKVIEFLEDRLGTE